MGMTIQHKNYQLPGPYYFIFDVKLMMGIRIIYLYGSGYQVYDNIPDLGQVIPSHNNNT